MPNLTIPDETFERLAKRAASLNITVEQLIAPLLDSAATHEDNNHPLPSATEDSLDEWKKKFSAWLADVESRADRYPPGFVMDDGRESIYPGCGE